MYSLFFNPKNRGQIILAKVDCGLERVNPRSFDTIEEAAIFAKKFAEDYLYTFKG